VRDRDIFFLGTAIGALLDRSGIKQIFEDDERRV